MLKLINAFIRGAQSKSHLTERSLANRVYINTMIACDAITDFSSPTLVVRHGVVWSSVLLPKSRDVELSNLNLEELNLKLEYEDILFDIGLGRIPQLGVYPVVDLRSKRVRPRSEVIEAMDLELAKLLRNIVRLNLVLDGKRGLMRKLATYTYIHLAAAVISVNDAVRGNSFT